MTRAAESLSLSVHRLVTGRHTPQPARRRAGLGPATRAGSLDGAFVGDPQDVRTWPTLDPLAPHVHMAASTRTAPASRTNSTAMTSWEVSQASGRPATARPSRCSTAPWTSTSRPTARPPRRRHRPSNLAALLQATNRMAKAEPLMCRARHLLEPHGPDHPNVAIGLSHPVSCSVPRTGSARPSR